MNKPNKRELVKIGRWLIDGETGQSSLSLASFFLTAGNGGECASMLYAPCDPSDFRRCVEFLEKCVDKSNHYNLIYAIGEMTEKWKRIRADWLNLMKLYNEEKCQSACPKLYELMKKLKL